ncbi:MAG TPA: DUF4231 domain-containing protein [Thermoanaerobaculia bacterium]
MELDGKPTDVQGGLALEPQTTSQSASLYQANACPPYPTRPRLVLRIGVTGHRIDKLPTGEHLDKLRESIRVALIEIKSIVAEIYNQRRRNNYLTYSDEEPLIRLVSPLAEGADRLVAQIATDEMGFELQCPLPFFEEEYKKQDFPNSADEFERLLKKATSVFQLDGSHESEEKRQLSYHMVGRTVLRQCDVLLAVWNGNPPSGIGGTAQIIDEALEFGVPVVWLHTDSHESYLLECGGRPGQGPRRSDISLLRKRIRRSFIFPSNDELGPADRFFKETQPSYSLGFVFKLFRRLFVSTWRWPKLSVQDFREQARENWKGTWEILSEAEAEKPEKEKAHPLETGYLESFAWADGLADHYADKYRSSFVTTYLMGALAILFAFLGFPPEAHNANRWTELILIGLIMVVIYWGRRREWHVRWLDYRALAEQFRQMQFLSLLGRITSSFQIPVHLETSNPQNKWFNWYFRAVVREVGLVRAKFNASYLDAYRQVLAGWIRSQAEYHRLNAENYKKLHRRLQKLSHFLFWVTLISCILHLCFHIKELSLPLGIGTIVLPAFAGAFGAITHIGEFERIASRSEALKANLEMLACELHCLGEDTTSRDLGQLAQDFSKMALDELVDWRFSFLKKELELPA